MWALQNPISPRLWHHRHWFEELQGSLRGAERKRKGSRKSRGAPLHSLSLPLTHKLCVAMLEQLNSAFISAALSSQRLFRLLRENLLFLHWIFPGQPPRILASVLCFSSERTLPSLPALIPYRTSLLSAAVGLLHRFWIFLFISEYSGALSFKSLGDTFLNNENYIFFTNSKCHYNELYLIDNDCIKQR